MALDRKFQKRLSKRGLNQATIAVLQKECILHDSTLELLKPADLELLRSKHNVTMGQFAILRTIHEELVAPPGETATPMEQHQRRPRSAISVKEKEEEEEDGFEIVRMEDVPLEMRDVAGGQRPASGGGSQRGGRGSYRVRGGGNSASNVMSQNLDRVVRREKKLQNVARAAEDVMSSAEEYNRLTTQLVEKQKRGILRNSKKSYSASAIESSGSMKSSGSRGRYSADQNHHPSRNHVQMDNDSPDVGPLRQRHKNNVGLHECGETDVGRGTDEEDKASTGCSCIIL